MPAIRGLTVAVGEWYARTLEICLVRNLRHLTECVVVTTPEDEAVKAVAVKVPGAVVFETDGFTRWGAHFNKGVCIEECFSFMGRHGWICVLDADILLPDSLPLDQIRPDTLHGAKRRMLADPAAWRPDLDWRMLPLNPDGGPIGYLQIFNSEHIKDKHPWYDPTFSHAGGGDAYFMEHFPRKQMLPMEVLHLGPNDTNWFGESPEARDRMAAFVHRNGWTRAAKKHDPAAVQRVGEFAERVGEQVQTEKGIGWQVPGFPVSFFELPFVRRAQVQRGRRRS
jgi:hypothetical protein